APPVASPIPAGGAARSCVAKHVVVIVMDGPRWSETWGEPTRKYIPHMATELAPLGALWTDFANDGATQTTADIRRSRPDFIKISTTRARRFRRARQFSSVS
ncbi:MAG: hypothetical protein AAB263_13845, partial [Planctomycetota bacterium]